MNKFTCKQCNYEWLARVENPKKCPACGRRNWTETKEQTEIKKLLAIVEKGGLSESDMTNICQELSDLGYQFPKHQLQEDKPF